MIGVAAESTGQGGAGAPPGAVFEVRNAPVMRVAVNALGRLGDAGRLRLRATGESIPNAVAVANIITERMMKGTSSIESISVDSESPAEFGRMLSVIEITLVKC